MAGKYKMGHGLDYRKGHITVGGGKPISPPALKVTTLTMKGAADAGIDLELFRPDHPTHASVI